MVFMERATTQADPATVAVGGTITFDVRVGPSGEENIAAAQLAIRFDSNILEVINVTPDPATLQASLGNPVIDAADGTGTAFFAAFTFAALSAEQGPFRLATIQFRAKGPEGSVTQVIFQVDKDRKTAVVNDGGEIVLDETQDYTGAWIEIVQ